MADVKKSPLAARLGPAFGQAYVEAYTELKGTEVEAPGGGGLPGGINNGVAHLDRINFGDFQTGKNKGKPYFQAFGIVQLPKVHDGFPTYGKQTKTQPEPLCDTTDPNERRTEDDNLRRTQKEHLTYIIKLLKLLNKQEDPPEPKKGQPWQKWVEAFEEYCYSLCKKDIYFSFRTWKPDPQQLVQERMGWFVVQGKTKFGPFGSEELAKKKFPNVGKDTQVREMWEVGVDFTPEGHGMDDQSGTSNGQVSVVEQPTEFVRPNGELAEQGTIHDEADAAFSSLSELVEAAPTSQPARNVLTEMAKECGYTKEQVANSDSWTQVGEWIEKSREEPSADTDVTTEPVEEGEYIPQKGQETHIKVKRKDGTTPEVKCSIIDVDVDKKTVDLRNLDTKAVYKSIAWDKLLQE